MQTLDIDPDTVMIAAGIVLSLVAALELYPAWKRARSGGRAPATRPDDPPSADG